MAQTLAALSLGDAAIRQLDGLYSLNDLHRAAGGAAKDRPQLFVRRQETQALIAELGACANSCTPLRTVNDGQNNGTYACRELVIAYAAWISAAFHLKVIRVFLAQATEPAQPAEHPMAYKQMLVRFDHLGRPGMGQILSDDTKVLSCTGMAAAIRGPNAGGWSNEVLLDLAEAIHARLTSEARRIFAMQRKENSHV